MPKQRDSRRSFLKKTGLSTGLLSAFGLPTVSLGSSLSPDSQTLKLAGYNYPRTRALFEKKVKIQGIDYEIQKDGISNLNTNIIGGPQDYDVTEIGLHPYLIAFVNDGFRDYQLLPIFPLRLFRHKSIFINPKSGIQKPEDLKGKRIGTVGYSTTSLTWIRGMLNDEYGIRPTDVQWVFPQDDSSKKFSGKSSRQENVLPEGLSYENGPEGVSESELLVQGNIDALFHAAQPKAFAEGNPNVVRLFPDSRKTEQDYYTRTGIFPIMHVVAVRRSLLENSPGLISAIFRTYSDAKAMHMDYMHKIGWAFETLPWFGQELESTEKVMGRNFYSYGFKENEKTLQTLLRYSAEQGLAKKQVPASSLFHPDSLALKE